MSQRRQTEVIKLLNLSKGSQEVKNKEQMGHIEKNGNIIDLNSIISIITLNVNVINTSNKRHRLIE